VAIERQELHCHNCNRYVQFDIDTEMDGNYVLNCPQCDHEHCRVVRQGRITDVRWDQRNGSMMTAMTSYNGLPVFNVNGTATTTTSSYSMSSSDTFITSSWLNSTSATTNGTWYSS
jgi:hypothetical protein